ncbi:MAG: nucleoside monophosphate kinase [Bryobacteraceae bacterium]|nr:nucleoside monophosphate kinase [Bryobacteraceae bacterium]
MVLLLFGPPGSGKGTQSASLGRWLQIPVVSTGHLLRSEVEEGTPLGLVAKDLLARGALVGDAVMNDMIAARLRRPDCGNGVILDGYPRTRQQAEYLDQLLPERGLPEPLVLHFDAPDPVLVTRLATRLSCPACGRVYNVKQRAPKRLGYCDQEGVALVSRSDDQYGVVVERLRTYREQTAPLIDFYRGRRLFQVNADRGPDEVLDELKGAVDSILVRSVRRRG